MKTWGWPCLVGIILSLFILSGCDVSQKLNLNFLIQESRRLTYNLYDFISNTISEEKKTNSSKDINSENSQNTLISSNAAKNAKANAEIFHEIYKVVLLSEPQDRSDFGNWVDTLNQGASIEGVYNGLTQSAQYRKLEVIQKGATAEALQIFGNELAWIELEFSKPTEFDTTAALPLAIATTLSDDLDTGKIPNEITFGNNSDTAASQNKNNSSKNLESLSEKYSKQFIGASIFTLKRVLGDEALKMMNLKTQYSEKLARWYAKWVIRIIQRHVDFGVALRNNPDEAFHYKWALEISPDRLKWEVLNRLHRVLNEANREK